MVTTCPPKTIVKPTALGPVANTDTKLLIYGLFQKGRVLAQDAIESSSSMLETVVGRAFRRRERLAALAAPVSTAFPGPRSVESVVNNASGTDCSIRRTCGIETSAILHFGSALTMRELCLQNSGSNSSTQTGYGLAANT